MTKQKGRSEIARKIVDRALDAALAGQTRFAPDELAPPVDTDLLGRFLREELPQDETENVCRLVGTFRVWFDACAAIQRLGLRR